MYRTIIKPTGFSKTSSTLIDNIFVNNLNEDYNAGLFISDMPHHLLIFIFRQTKLCLGEVVMLSTMPICDSAIALFQTKLSEIQRTQFDTSKDVRKNYDCFLTIFDKLSNESFPIKTTKLKVFRGLSKPWIAIGHFKSIKKKEKLHKTWHKKRTT